MTDAKTTQELWGEKKRQSRMETKRVTRAFLAEVVGRYHNQTVAPLLLDHEERLTYLQMWPWQKAWYHWLRFVGWLNKRWTRVRRAWYARKWYKEDARVRERMVRGETVED